MLVREVGVLFVCGHGDLLTFSVGGEWEVFFSSFNLNTTVTAAPGQQLWATIPTDKSIDLARMVLVGTAGSLGLESSSFSFRSS